MAVLGNSPFSTHLTYGGMDPFDLFLLPIKKGLPLGSPFWHTFYQPKPFRYSRLMVMASIGVRPMD